MITSARTPLYTTVADLYSVVILPDMKAHGSGMRRFDFTVLPKESMSGVPGSSICHRFKAKYQGKSSPFNGRFHG